MQKLILILATLLVNTALSATQVFSSTYYVREDGGTYAQCSGLVDAPYTSGTACAWKHPFDALPPGATPRIAGGDTLIVKNGSYRMGHTVGVYATGSCSASWPWDCSASAIPAGTESNPTRIVGEGWSNGCTTKPELYGVENTSSVLNASNDYVEVQCLEITDHNQCIKGHGATGPTDGKISCASTYPYGDFAVRGIVANGADNLLIKNVEIHGISNDGLYSSTGGSNWVLDNINVHNNGWSGWDGGSFSGTMTIKNSAFQYNGCGETYPNGETIGCWSQTAGGYGDAIGMANTGGTWLVEDTVISHNTSDGLDLLYVDDTGKVSVNRVKAEGNAGNQLKIAGKEMSILNSVAIGNCGYFENQTFSYAVDNCRALGHPLTVNLRQGGTADIVNTSLYSEGDGVFNIIGGTCNGTEKVTMRNVAAVGDIDFHQDYEKSAYLWTQCAGVTIDHDYEYIYNLKNNSITITSELPFTDIKGPNSFYLDPQFIQASTASDNFDLRIVPTSLAIDSGLPVGTIVGITQVPSIDYNEAVRTVADIGAFEWGAVVTPSTPTTSTIIGIFKLNGSMARAKN